MSNGTQANGLPVQVKKHDTITSHDWTDNTSWPETNDSGWVLEPDADEVLVLTEVHAYFSENLVVHEGGQLLVQFYMNGNSEPVLTRTYNNMKDWVSRALEHYHIEFDEAGTELTSHILHFVITFAQKPILWSSVGVDALGNPKFNKMVIKINNDTAYQKVGGGAAEIARARYLADVYDDPDV